MFKKDIARDLRGVIKVDQLDEADVKQELEEYVVTKELHKHFSTFYENYLRGIDGQTDKIGVWISGFFGSGKSHFLKILSYLLNNNEVAGKTPIEYFEDKISDPIVYANMQKTADVPTETILFNIDSKSQINNKSKEDAILNVLLKVFNEHRGYYGDNLGIAKLEQYLDERGLFDSFKQAFEKAANESWENRRSTFYFDNHYVKSALLESTDMTEEAVDNWLTNGIDNITVSIEDFAKEVKAYIDTKEENFHLVFLIDEIGQYIGDSRALMLNLQTVTENLGALCNGQAWVMVTSQESIDSIVTVRGDDFSRIQGRFDTKLSLSSVAVDEVIQKRILEKQEHVNESLQATYPNKDAILKNLISFRDNTADLRGYQDAEEYAEVYPFIPYQFRLLQNVFEQVRKHGSSGKHLSEGERSMLSAYREAGMRFMEEEKGTLIPFYSFYDTIKEFLQPSVSRVIENAARNSNLSDDPINVELLKVLFMIKYVKELPSNIDNLATLMITHVDEDKLELKEKIKTSLRKLIKETLIEKNGDEYFFLTDDEQDVNNEIKHIAIEDDVLRRELARYVYDDLYDVKKYRYSNIYDFSFNKIIDERNHGNQSAMIGMEILSPLSEKYGLPDQQLQMQSSSVNNVIIKLGNNDDYIEELEAALKIEEYRKSRNIHQLPENIQNILNNKQVEVRERRNRARDMLTEALKESSFYVNGSEIEVRGSSINDKLNGALKVLVDNVYTKLPYIEKHMQSERELNDYILTTSEQTTLNDEVFTQYNAKAKQEVDAHIRMQHEMKQQVRVKSLFDHFEAIPYGWQSLDIAQIIAQLLKEQRIRITYNAEYLEPDIHVKELMTVFTKNLEADKAIVSFREEIDEGLIRQVRGGVRDLFDKRDLPEDEDGLIKEIRHLMEKEIDMINNYKSRYENRPYPGMTLLDKGLEHFEQFDHKIDNLTFLKRFKDLEDDIGDWLDDIASLKSFFDSNQKNLFDKGLAALEKYEEVKHYVYSDEVKTAMDELKDIVNDPVPYHRIQDISPLVHTLDKHIESILKEKREATKEKVAFDRDEVALQFTYDELSEETTMQIKEQFNNLLTRAENEQEIHRVDALVAQSGTYKERMMKLINEEVIEERRKRALEEKKNKEQNEHLEKDDEINSEPVQVEVPTEKVDVNELVSTGKLATEEDVELYINTLSRKLKDIIKSNKQIEIEKTKGE